MADEQYVYVRLRRPEGYEDVASELVIEDAFEGDKAAFCPEDVTQYVCELEVQMNARTVAIITHIARCSKADE